MSEEIRIADIHSILAFVEAAQHRGAFNEKELEILKPIFDEVASKLGYRKEENADQS